MRKLRELEDLLIRAESALAVVLVLTMLALAGYNVVYRNVLVPLQQHWAHSGPPVAPRSPEASAAADSRPAAESAVPSSEAEPQPKREDDFGGFGGGFDEDKPSTEDEPAPAPAAGSAEEDFGGFGGGFEKPEPEPGPEPEPRTGSDEFGGFGGGFGDDDASPTPAGKADDDAPREDEDDSFGDADDQFANLPSVEAAGEPVADEGPQGGPPAPDSFAAWAVDTIDAIKLDWIDVLLRHLVIIVAFLGAMIATRRGKHINIDAVSKLLPPRARRVMPVLLNLVSMGVCFILARAGWDLVSIGREFPKELMPGAMEWHFQLMFPVGFGVMALHFGVRLVESILQDPAAVTPDAAGPTPEPPEPEPEPAEEDDDAVDQPSTKEIL